MGCRKIISAFRRNEDGQFAIQMAFLALPLSIAIMGSFDINEMVRDKAELQEALDRTVLAAVGRGNLTKDEREAYAIKVFAENFADTDNVTLTALSSGDDIRLSARYERVSLLGKLPTFDTTEIEASSKAEVTREQVVCVLALDRGAEGAVRFKDSAEFDSPNCVVQANSTHGNAIFNETGLTVAAEQFCAQGGMKGSFRGSTKTGCRAVDDPFVNRKPPDKPGGCVAGLLNSVASAVMSPGHYCNGLKIDTSRVLLEEGIYHVTGELSFTGNSNIRAENVTFVLHGDGKIKVDNRAKVRIKAPAFGETAGMAFWQVKPAGGSVIQSEISASGKVDIVGTAYLPKTDLKMVSDKKLASSSPATSIVVNTIEFGGQSYTRFETDHASGGIPPLKPRSDEGAVLVR